jgi:hypothetical protein
MLTVTVPEFPVIEIPELVLSLMFLLWMKTSGFGVYTYPHPRL